MKDLFGTEIEPGDTVAVSRQVGYNVRQYAGTVLDVVTKDGATKVRVDYRQPAQRSYGTPERPQWVGITKVVVIDKAAPVV